ncbi:YdcF family protein [Tunicatimonas pelagia]|uniref:YdcF family protein n=1 Tax=Tunicatimonas pelagia TaxID=931531 RepID=UPI0026670209|nr:YdcF family protein [Tunicatimonas pelagia]WKN44063.1 YdcF family protein [Tunicatimonas pelagia]
MFFLLSKTLYFLVMPVTLVMLAFVLCIFWKRHRKLFFAVGFSLLLLFTNTFLSNLLLLVWETPPEPIASLPQYPVGVVLGGITIDKEPRDRSHVTGDADRILHAIQLYRAGKIEKILLSGGSGKILVDSIPEAISLKRILRNAQVPEEDILVEADSRNTRENALNSQNVLRENSITSKVLLITSAYHMRRAKACFDKADVPTDVFSVSMRSKDPQFTPDWLIIPNSRAIGNFEVVIREMVGTIAYWAAGYI